MKVRYLIELSYRGTSYHGWQSQLNALSIQQVVEECFSRYLGAKTKIVASGRTDTGVHALQQFVHVDIDENVNMKEFTYRMNAFLPGDIVLKDYFPLKKDAHARFSAYSRSYIYKIHEKKDPFLNEFSYYYNRPLNLNLLNNAAAYLIGEKDFKCFSKSKTDVNNFICNISDAHWEKKGSQIFFYISANRFLRGMVRAVVGTLLEIGNGNQNSEYIQNVVHNKDRRLAGKAVPAHGLYLKEVKYPGEIIQQIK